MVNLTDEGVHILDHPCQGHQDHRRPPAPGNMHVSLEGPDSLLSECVRLEFCLITLLVLFTDHPDYFSVMGASKPTTYSVGGVS